MMTMHVTTIMVKHTIPRIIKTLERSFSATGYEGRKSNKGGIKLMVYTVFQPNNRITVIRHTSPITVTYITIVNKSHHLIFRQVYILRILSDP